MGWLKFCYSLAESGVNVITGDLIGAAGSGIEAVKNAYNAYHEKDRTQQSLDVLMRAPLLLPTEQEQLIQSLRDQKFFDDFKYDPQRGQWVKNDADHPSGRSEPAVGCLFPAATSGAVAVDPVQLNEVESPLNHLMPPLQRQSSVLRDLEALGMRGFHEGELDLLARALEDRGFDTSDSLRDVPALVTGVLKGALQQQGMGQRSHGLAAKVHMAISEAFTS